MLSKYIHVSRVLESPVVGAVHQWWPQWGAVKDHRPAGNTCPYAAQHTAGLLYHKRLALALYLFLQISCMLFSKASSYLLIFVMYWWRRLCLPKSRTVHFPLLNLKMFLFAHFSNLLWCLRFFFSRKTGWQNNFASWFKNIGKWFFHLGCNPHYRLEER